MKLSSQYILDDYTIEEVLSQTECSQICKVRSQKENKFYVEKIYPADKREIFEVVKKLESSYFPKIKHIVFAEDTIVIEEFVTGKTLLDLIQENKIFSHSEIQSIIEQLGKAIELLHKNCIIHRDIKPSNIIIQENNIVKLIDFGIARFYEEDKEKDTEHHGTRGYAAPEQFGYSQTDFRSDIYSFGKTLEFISKHFPLNSLQNEIMYKAIAFDPAQRFQAMSEVFSFINRKRNKDNRKIYLWISILMCLPIAAILYSYDKNFLINNEEPQTNYEEPVFSQSEVDASENEQVDDLQKVTNNITIKDESDKYMPEINPPKELLLPKEHLENNESLETKKLVPEPIAKINVENDNLPSVVNCYTNNQSLLIPQNSMNSMRVILDEFGSNILNLSATNQNEVLSLKLSDNNGNSSTHTYRFKERENYSPEDAERIDCEIVVVPLGDAGNFAILPCMANRKVIVGGPKNYVWVNNAQVNCWGIHYNKQTGFREFSEGVCGNIIDIEDGGILDVHGAGFYVIQENGFHEF